MTSGSHSQCFVFVYIKKEHILVLVLTLEIICHKSRQMCIYKKLLICIEKKIDDHPNTPQTNTFSAGWYMQIYSMVISAQITSTYLHHLR